jgi:hypothetical protein
MAQPNVFATAKDAETFLISATDQLVEVRETFEDLSIIISQAKEALATGTVDATTKASYKAKRDEAAALITKGDGLVTAHAAKVDFVDSTEFSRVQGSARLQAVAKEELKSYKKQLRKYRLQKDLASHQMAQLDAAMTPDRVDLVNATANGLVQTHQIGQQPQHELGQSQLQNPPGLHNPPYIASPSRASPTMYLTHSSAPYALQAAAPPAATNPTSMGGLNTQMQASHRQPDNQLSQLPSHPFHNAASTIATTSHTGIRDINIKHWNVYDDRHMPINNWLAELKRRLQPYGTDGERQRFQIIYDLIKGEPGKWLRNQRIPDTVEELEDMLLVQFGRTDATATLAQARLDSLRLYEGTATSVDKLAWQIEDWFPHAYPDEPANGLTKLLALKRSLPATMVHLIDVSDNPPTTFVSYVLRAKKLEGGPHISGPGLAG